jgi:hypothetical protein
MRFLPEKQPKEAWQVLPELPVQGQHLRAPFIPDPVDLPSNAEVAETGQCLETHDGRGIRLGR